MRYLLLMRGGRTDAALAAAGTCGPLAEAFARQAQRQKGGIPQG
jgi:hypothetical protein